jgi:hypothetical protein
VKNSARDNVGVTASREREDSHMRLSSIRDGLSACYRSEACLDALLVAALVSPAYLLADLASKNFTKRPGLMKTGSLMRSSRLYCFWV